MNLCIAHGGDLTDPSGGTDRVTALAAGLSERGHEVTIVAPEEPGTYPDRLSTVSLSLVDVPLSNPVVTGLSVTLAATRTAAEQDAILQFEHSTLAGIGTLHGSSGYVLDMHDLAHSRFDVVETPGAAAFQRATEWLERRAVRRAAHVITVSEPMRDVLCDTWGEQRERVSVVPNGYYPDRIEQYLHLEPVEGRVVFLGTLHPKVDFETFGVLADLEAVSEMVVIGDGGRRQTVERLASGHDSVRYCGRLPDDEAFELLASAEMAINPQSQSELQRSSSPVKLYNYAALGLPMVVTPGPAVVSELLASDAAVVASGSDEFAEVVSLLLENDSRRQSLSENARTAAERFQWDRRVEEIGDLYERVAKRGIAYSE